ncbi:MAG: AMP-binding protein, partial [Acidisphaera sp.]|nr:AMP-binding protein [Acidisphaera sp.]
MADASIYERDLDRTPANYVPLSPISFLLRSAHVYGGRTAILHGERRISYAGMLERCRRLASALAQAGVGRGDTVAVIAPNVPEMLEAHYAVPMLGAVLCPINTRLDAGTVAFILQHSEARVLIADAELSPIVGPALASLARRPLVIDIDDPLAAGGERIGAHEYEAFIAGGDPAHPVRLPQDEWQAIALGYTSGTTGDPKGVVTHHRGAYLNACAGALEFQLSPESVFLWTLPMFHCNGWSYTWGVTLAGAMHVCLRRVEPALVYRMIGEHGVTHLCGAPVVLTMLIHAPDARPLPRPVRLMTGGAAPPSPVIARMEQLNFLVRHLYGLTETYGPSMVNAWQPGLEAMPLEQKAAFMARQGVVHHMMHAAGVFEPQTMAPVPADGSTIGELMLRGNTIMRG